MRLILRSLFVFALILLFAFRDKPVNDSLDKIVKLLAAYTHFRPQEKLYVHLDKPIYAAGESMWFKTYLVSAAFHTADSLSLVVYVELLDDDKKVIQRRTLYSPGGTSHGDFTLDDALPEGKYVIRAYTNYMKNLGEDFFFLKEVNILNPSQPSTDVVSGNGYLVDLQFFPEGGNFLSGVDNRIAFKAINDEGKGIAAEGEILDESNNVVTTFKTEHNGMGMIRIFPSNAQKRYQAKLKSAQSTTGIFPLPSVVEKGYLLRVTEEGDNIKVIAYSNIRHFSNEPCYISLVTQSRGVVTFAARGEISGTTLIQLIPKNKFPTGITQITLFDAASVPQCERLIFVDHQDGLSCSVTADKSSYTKRSKANVRIEVKDKTGAPVPGNFSLSVYDDTKIKDPVKYPLTISNYLLLTSELTGKIEEPGYYFKDNLPPTKYHRDLLMMSHGWRRFSWKTILQDTVWALSHYTERGIVVSGTVLKAFAKNAAAGATIKIFTNEAGIASLVSDSLGRFFTDSFQYYDSVKMVIQTDNSKGKQTSLQFTLDPFNVPAPSDYIPSPYYSIDASAFLTQAREHNRITDVFDRSATMLKAVEVTATKIQEREPTMYGIPNQTIKMDATMENMSSILTVLQLRVAGLIITGSPPNAQVSLRGAGTPLFLLDDSPTDLEIIATVPPSDVDYIDVIKGAGVTVFGSAGANGVIAIKTKKGFRYGGVIVGIHRLTYPGFYKAREFYVPKYDVPDDKHNFPDMRSTLYWNPDVQTDSTGKANVSFYTGDVPSSYKIVLEGISKEGVPGCGQGILKTH